MTLLVEGLSVRYGALAVLDRVSFEVGDGDAVGFFGANGAGKTTLLRALSGLLRFHGGSVTAGRVVLDGRDVTAVQGAALMRCGVGHVLEGRRVFSTLTVDENLRVGAFATGSRAGELRRRALELFPPLADRLHVRAALLSGGEQQMLVLARALMGAPRLLLLDEPSLGLAPLVVRRIGEILGDVRRGGVALLLAEQSTALALDVTDNAHLLEHGRVSRSGRTADLVADGAVRAAYLGTSAGDAIVKAASA